MKDSLIKISEKGGIRLPNCLFLKNVDIDKKVSLTVIENNQLKVKIL